MYIIVNVIQCYCQCLMKTITKLKISGGNIGESLQLLYVLVLEILSKDESKVYNNLIFVNVNN